MPRKGGKVTAWEAEGLIKIWDSPALASSGDLRLFHSNPWHSGAGNSRTQMPAGRGSSLEVPVTLGARPTVAVTQHSCAELHTRAVTKCQRDVPWSPCDQRRKKWGCRRLL